MRNINKYLLGLSAFIAGLIGFTSVAGATPTPTETLATDMGTDTVGFFNGSIVPLVATIMGVVVIAGIAFRWVKKYTNRASS